VRATPDLIVLRYVARIRLSVGVADEVELSASHTDHYEKRDVKGTVVWSQATEIRPDSDQRPTLPLSDGNDWFCRRWVNATAGLG
jgi:hypothetical protein